MKGWRLLAGLAVLAAGWPASGQEALDFHDDFTGETLSPEFRILNPDPNRMAMVDGDYVLVVTHRDVKNVIAYTGQLPGDYELTVRFASTPIYPRQGVSLVLGETGNQVVAGLYLSEYYPNYKPSLYFDKHLGDEVSKIAVEIAHEDLKPFYLKITKTGVEYHAAFSFDGMKWVPIGTHVAIRPFSRAAVTAYNSDGEAPESPIRIDSFEVKEKISR